MRRLRRLGTWLMGLWILLAVLAIAIEEFMPQERSWHLASGLLMGAGAGFGVSAALIAHILGNMEMEEHDRRMDEIWRRNS